MPVLGKFEGVFDGVAVGWVCQTEHLTRRFKVEILSGEEVLGIGTANLKNPYLLENGIGDGGYGFSININDSTLTGGETLKARIFGSSAWLQGEFDWPYSDHDFMQDESQMGKGDLPSSIRPAMFSPSNIQAGIDSLIGNVEPEARLGNDVKLIAYYLPQFHPIPENDEWWGPGFTEWTNVVQAKKYFPGHHQPQIPGELGFYDLRLAEVREKQAALAREYGIYGFCYYYYWFEGRRLLERPLQEMFESKSPDFPFCICWANENWTRRWDGQENDVLLQQKHNEKTDVDFIRDVIPLFKDDRYIKVNGAPLLIIYRLSLLPDPIGTAERWRKICAEEGFPRIHLCMAETFGLNDPWKYGFDSAVQFPPHNVVAVAINSHIPDLDPAFSGSVYDYMDVVKDQLSKDLPHYRRYPAVMTSWDNTARKKSAGNVFYDATPQKYEIWLRGAIDQARERLPEGERYVFINAWNEWAEGAHLEPDRENGRSFLAATKRALTGCSDWNTVMQYADSLDALSGVAKESVLQSLRFSLQKLELVNRQLQGVIGRDGIPKSWVSVKPGLPNAISEIPLHVSGVGKIDRLNNYQSPGDSVFADSKQKLIVSGWAFSEGDILNSNTPSYLIFRNKDSGLVFYCPVMSRLQRNDVAEYFPKVEKKSTLYSGLEVLADIGILPFGYYVLSMVSRYGERVVEVQFDPVLEVN